MKGGPCGCGDERFPPHPLGLGRVFLASHVSGRWRVSTLPNKGSSHSVLQRASSVHVDLWTFSDLSTQYVSLQNLPVTNCQGDREVWLSCLIDASI